MAALTVPELPELPENGSATIPELPAPPIGAGRKGKRECKAEWAELSGLVQLPLNNSRHGGTFNRSTL